MLKLRQAVIVEGRYDRVKLSSLIDAPIIETGGFRVFNDKEKQCLIRKIAETRGIMILTDSDGAGFVIRNFLKGIVPADKLVNCYIPQIEGKEKRKPKKSREGLLGVEGMTDELILSAIRRSGAVVEGEEAEKARSLTKSDLYELGLTGRENSQRLRERLLRSLGLPTYLSTNAMLTALGCLYSYEELEKLVEALTRES